MLSNNALVVVADDREQLEQVRPHPRPLVTLGRLDEVDEPGEGVGHVPSEDVEVGHRERGVDVGRVRRGRLAHGGRVDALRPGEQPDLRQAQLGQDFTKGDRLTQVPEHSFSLWTTYKVLPKLTVGGGAYYVDKVYGNSDSSKNPDGTPKARWVPSYWRFDAMASYEFNPNVSAQLNVMNIFDETYYTKAYAAHYAALGGRRAALLSLRVRY